MRSIGKTFYSTVLINIFGYRIFFRNIQHGNYCFVSAIIFPSFILIVLEHLCFQYSFLDVTITVQLFSLETIKSIISLHMVIKQGSFGCKLCKNVRVSSPTKYAKHILRAHNRIVDPNYHTHILIQARYDKWQLTHYFYLPVLS